MKYTKPTIKVVSDGNGGTSPTPRGGCSIYVCEGKHTCTGKKFSCTLLYI